MGARNGREWKRLDKPGGIRCQAPLTFKGPDSPGRGRPDGVQKLGLLLDWSHTAAQFGLESPLSSLGFVNVIFFLVNLRPAICLFQEAGGKRVGESRGAGPRPFSGWAGVPAVGLYGPTAGDSKDPGSWGWPVPRELMASWSCQSRLLQGQFGKTQSGDLEGGPGLVGTAGGAEGERGRWEESLTKSS